MLKFFTNGTWQPRTGEIEQVSTPVGEPCLACRVTIGADDCGVSMVHMYNARGDADYRPWHLACFLRALGIERTET